MDDLLNSTTLPSKIVTSSIFLVIKILAIENHKFDSTFLHLFLQGPEIENQKTLMQIRSADEKHEALGSKTKSARGSTERSTRHRDRSQVPKQNSSVETATAVITKRRTYPWEKSRPDCKASDDS
jgi:hypothetical protein